MKTARFYGAGDIRVEDVATPEPTDDQVLVAVEWCGICGSDLSEYLKGPLHVPSTRTGPHPLSGETLPLTMGHEFCGRVVDAPPNSPFKNGQGVMVDPRLYCSSCSACSSAHGNICKKLGFLGISGGGGGLSERVAVNTAMLHPLPPSVDLNHAALVEPLAVAWHAVKQSEITDFRGVPALIVGAGSVGVAVAHVLRAQQADQVFVSEPMQKRSQFLKGLVESIFNPRQDSVSQACLNLTGSIGVRVVFDCTGTQNGLNDAVSCLQFRGVCVCVGLPSSQIVLPYHEFFTKEITVRPSSAYDSKDFEETVTAFAEGKFPEVAGMVSDRISLGEVVQKGFQALVEHGEDHLKILVSPRVDE